MHFSALKDADKALALQSYKFNLKAYRDSMVKGKQKFWWGRKLNFNRLPGSLIDTDDLAWCIINSTMGWEASHRVQGGGAAPTSLQDGGNGPLLDNVSICPPVVLSIESSCYRNCTRPRHATLNKPQTSSTCLAMTAKLFRRFPHDCPPVLVGPRRIYVRWGPWWPATGLLTSGCPL